MKSILLLLLIFLPSLTYADYYFRSSAPEVIASISTGGGLEDEGLEGDGSEKDEPTESHESCYNSSNIGKIGEEGWFGCEGMLIVSGAMMRNAVEINDGQDREITHSGRTFTFGDSANNIFTGQVEDMSYMFLGSGFNADIGYWDTSSVTNMYAMFYGVSSFNTDIGGWDTSSVMDMSGMFGYAPSFNANIGGWNTSSVTNMSNMFYNASAFNADIGGWNASSVKDMRWMFGDASSFNQDLSGWCVTNIATRPASFSNGSNPDWENDTARQPQWGSCPGGN